VQHLHYLPWGEDFVNQRSSSWNAMYTFSAKEKDTETGYSYFGARYYSSDLSIWLSVDPMSDKYPSLSPYVYCSNNPVKLVDPNGEDITKFEDVNGNLIKQIDDGSNAVFRQFGNRKGMHYEFTGFDESQGGKNEVNLGTAIQEQQQLNNNNTYLKENGGVTYCNIATQNVMKTVASVPGFEKALVTGNANEMYDAMDNNANFVSVSKSQAIKFGKKGLAIVAYKNTKGGPGHVATFSAGTNEGEVANIGPAEYTGFTTVNGAIATTKAKKYFIFRPGYISKPIQVK
jgi:RHS repeat-associated protein